MLTGAAVVLLSKLAGPARAANLVAFFGEKRGVRFNHIATACISKGIEVSMAKMGGLPRCRWGSGISQSFGNSTPREALSTSSFADGTPLIFKERKDYENSVYYLAEGPYITYVVFKGDRNWAVFMSRSTNSVVET